MPRPRRAIAATLVALPFAAALIPFVLPPWIYGLILVRIAATELGPAVAVAALALGALAIALEGPRRAWLAAATVVTVALAAWPTLAAQRAARHAPLASVTDKLAIDRWFGALHALPATPSVVEREVRYTGDDGAPLTMRVFRDANACRSECPAVAVLYAGAWRNGDARQAAPINRWIAAHGYVVVALDYGHAPRAKHPAQRADVVRGLTVLRDSAVAWGVDTGRVALWGRSSGGHLATLTAWSANALPVRVRGVISFYGPFDLARGYVDVPRPDPLDVRAVLRDFTGGTPAQVPAVYRDASPRTWVRSGLPPTLLVYAGGDHLVKPEFGRTAAAALRAAGDSVVYVEMPFAEHAFDLAVGGPTGVAALDVAMRFLSQALGPVPLVEKKNHGV